MRLYGMLCDCMGCYAIVWDVVRLCDCVGCGVIVWDVVWGVGCCVGCDCVWYGGRINREKYV